MSFRTDDLPGPPSGARQFARFRLRSVMEDERRRSGTRRTRRRIVVTAAVMALVMGVSPPGTGGDLQPLIGLADAVASSPPPLEPVVRHWYARTESTELITVPDPIVREEALEFLVNAVEETWHDGSSQPRRTKTYGAPIFLSPEDERVFRSSGLADAYADGLVEELPVHYDHFAFVERLAMTAPEQLGSALRRQVSGLGDRRVEEAHLLRLTADLMQLHADDPFVRAQVLRVIADIPGIAVMVTSRTVTVAFDYVDGDQPLRLEYEFDAETAHLVGESLAVLATRTEPGSIIRTARHTLGTPDGVSES